MAELTRRELDSLNSETRTYKPVGKMYIFETCSIEI